MGTMWEDCSARNVRCADGGFWRNAIVSMEDFQMIDLNRVRKALEAVRVAQKELEAALADVEQPPPDPPPKPVRVARQRSMRRVR